MVNTIGDASIKKHDNALNVIPQNNQVLCRMLTSNFRESTTAGLICKVPDIQTYEVLDISKNFDNSKLGLKIGDVIVCNSTGTFLEDPSLDEKLYLFPGSSIAAKICN